MDTGKAVLRWEWTVARSHMRRGDTSIITKMDPQIMYIYLNVSIYMSLHLVWSREFGGAHEQRDFAGLIGPTQAQGLATTQALQGLFEALLRWVGLLFLGFALAQGVFGGGVGRGRCRGEEGVEGQGRVLLDQAAVLFWFAQRRGGKGLVSV